jgi:hypothetical protein
VTEAMTMWGWKRKRDTNAEGNAPDAGTDFDLVESLSQAAAEGNLQTNDLFLSVVFGPHGVDDRPGRQTVLLGNGQQIVQWDVESLRSLFRGNRQPPPDAEMEHYPEAYVPFFYRVEYNVFRYCRTAELKPTDGEFIDIYSLMRRLPDGKSTGPLHDVIWQSAALVLGLRPWSEAEYGAVFGQLARSARHFKLAAGSRNYFEYVLQKLGKAS